jgi:hypothetical protein
MRRVAALFAAAATLMLPAGASQGALEPRGALRLPAPLELVVFEANGCTYCEVFRRQVLPLYRATEKGKQAPIRFVNLSYADESKMGLSEPITIVPTAVLLEEGRERGRVTGYTGPDVFLDMVTQIMGEPG